MNKEINEKQMRKIYSKELIDVMKDKGIEDRIGGLNMEEQTDLNGKKLDVEEIEEMKRATIYVAGNFKARVSEAMEEKFEAMDAGKKRKWLKHTMRAVKNSEPTGKDFEEDFKVLYAHVFG